MKQVFLFKLHGESKADKLEEIRAQIKGQIADGVVVFGGETEFIGVFSEPPEPRPLLPVIAPDVLSAAPEAESLEIPLMRRRIERVSLAEMKAAIAAGHGREFIQPRDEFEIKLDTGETVTAVCGGYVDDRRARFVFKDALGDAPMNDDATNEGGYFKSKGRKRVLEDIYPHLPPELRAVIEPRPLVEIVGGEKVEYSDPLWLPSATDVFGPREWWPEEPDSVQLEIFKTERGRVKERNGETVSWWLRSPRRGHSTLFVIVITDGTVYSLTATYSRAFAPGFDL